MFRFIKNQLTKMFTLQNQNKNPQNILPILPVIFKCETIRKTPKIQSRFLPKKKASDRVRPYKKVLPGILLLKKLNVFA